MKKPKKFDYPVEKARRYLEPGPVVLVSSAFNGETNIMTMGWHMMLEFSPSLFGCLISDGNYSSKLIRKSKECVINVPTLAMAKTVVDIGNCDGDRVDKFAKFKLTPGAAEKVDAPLIEECYANFECKLHDGRMINKYNLYILEIVKAHVARTPKNPKTIHYQGDGQFMVAGAQLNLRKRFKPSML